MLTCQLFVRRHLQAAINALIDGGRVHRAILWPGIAQCGTPGEGLRCAPAAIPALVKSAILSCSCPPSILHFAFLQFFTCCQLACYAHAPCKLAAIPGLNCHAVGTGSSPLWQDTGRCCPFGLAVAQEMNLARSDATSQDGNTACLKALQLHDVGQALDKLGTWRLY